LRQEILIFQTQPDWTIQDEMTCKGLGNRCSIRLSYGTASVFKPADAL